MKIGSDTNNSFGFKKIVERLACSPSNQPILQAMSKYPDQVRKDAQACVRHIHEHGWCQGAFRNPRGQICAGRAITMTTRVFGDKDRFWQLANAFMAEAGQDVVGYND